MNIWASVPPIIQTLCLGVNLSFFQGLKFCFYLTYYSDIGVGRIHFFINICIFYDNILSY